MRLLRTILVVAALLAAAWMTTSGRAATFSGGSADITDFAGGSEVSTEGTLISAVNLLNDWDGSVGISTTINGVLFKSTQPGQFFEGNDPTNTFAGKSFVYHGGGPYADPNLWSSGGAYDTLADSQLYSIDGGNTNDGYGVVNLTPGTQYLLQVFMLDDRDGVSKDFPLQFKEVKWTGSFDNIDGSSPTTQIGLIPSITIGGNGVHVANGEIATIRFSIDPGYNGLLVNPQTGNGALNGIQLRQVPEPTAITLFSIGAAMLVGLRRRSAKC
jgi:hypothetical protein